MLQIFLGSYIVLSLLAAIVIWRALAVSNRADEEHLQESQHTKEAMGRMNHANVTHDRVFGRGTAIPSEVDDGVIGF